MCEFFFFLCENATTQVYLWNCKWVNYDNWTFSIDINQKAHSVESVIHLFTATIISKMLSVVYSK